MNNFSVLDSCNRRNFLSQGMNPFSPPFHLDYSTDTNMKNGYGDMYINTMHLIPEPMKMNLADSVVPLDEKTNMAAEAKKFVNKNMQNTDKSNTRSDYYPSLAGIASFFSGVFNIMGAMFNKRGEAPAQVQYYDCYEQSFEDPHQRTLSSLAWRPAKREDRNKNGRAEADDFADETLAGLCADMNEDLRRVWQCENKLNQVRSLLSSHTVTRARPRPRARRPKRAFHEAGSVDELFEDAFSPEDFISLANETFLEYCGPFSHHGDELFETDSPKVKVDVAPVKESMSIVQNVPEKDFGESEIKAVDKAVAEDSEDSKKQVVSSCEDKVSKLKALLQERRKNRSQPIDVPAVAETPGSVTESSDSSSLDILITEIPNLQLKSDRAIPIPIPQCKENQSDALFGQEIKIPDSPKSDSNYFDEVTGRFCTSADSEDSFQIVFTDVLPTRRQRLSSDCDSEDSFIVFEESPDSCYTSNDAFGDEDVTNISSDSDDSDCESDFDSGVSIPKLCHTLSRTFGDLTDGSLYESVSEDVVDCAFRSAGEVPSELVVEPQQGPKGLLLDEARKREKKKLPAKKVQFSEQPPKVHVMRVWTYAARQARAGHWERHALDRERFKRRIADVDMAVSWVLKPQHRSRVMFQRFMPWWNAQKRKELAEKKQKDEEERLRREKEAETEREERVEGTETDDLAEGELADTESEKDCKREESAGVKTIVSNGVDFNVNCVNESIKVNQANVNNQMARESKVIKQNGDLNKNHIKVQESKILKNIKRNDSDIKDLKLCNGLKNGIDKSCYQIYYPQTQPS